MYDMKALYQAESVQDAVALRLAHPQVQIIAGGFSVGAGNVAILVLVCIMVAETVATFAWFLKWMGYCLPGEPSEEVAAGAPLPRAMAFVFIVLIIMVIVGGPLSASWIG